MAFNQAFYQMSYSRPEWMGLVQSAAARLQYMGQAELSVEAAATVQGSQHVAGAVVGPANEP